jgi:probable HAF family extracellular repeat protein
MCHRTRSISLSAIVFCLAIANVRSLPANPFVFTTIDYPGAEATRLHDVNNKGEIVGQYRDAGRTYHSMLKGGQVFSTITPPGANGPVSAALGINDAGQIVGAFRDTNSTDHAYVKNGDSITVFDHPNAGSGRGNFNNYRGTYFNDINNAGIIVGNFTGNDDFDRAFIKVGDTLTTFDHPAAVYETIQGFLLFGIAVLGTIFVSRRDQSQRLDGR